MEINNQFLDINTIKQKSYNDLSSSNIKEDNSLIEVCNSVESFFMKQILEVSLKSSKIA